MRPGDWICAKRVKAAVAEANKRIAQLDAECDRYQREIAAIRAEPPAPEVALPEQPDGWVLVPREPTDAMCDAATRSTSAWMNSKLRGIELRRLKLRIRWGAMLAAAPSSPVAGGPSSAADSDGDSALNAGAPGTGQPGCGYPGIEIDHGGDQCLSGIIENNGGITIDIGEDWSGRHHGPHRPQGFQRFTAITLTLDEATRLCDWLWGGLKSLATGTLPGLAEDGRGKRKYGPGCRTDPYFTEAPPAPLSDDARRLADTLRAKAGVRSDGDAHVMALAADALDAAHAEIDKLLAELAEHKKQCSAALDRREAVIREREAEIARLRGSRS